jgi:alkylation response protein AidB-like acyl-CoA dehydrogenase
VRRTVFTEEHEDFRATVRSFLESRVVPVYDQWYEAGIVPRELYYELGELGVLGIEVPELYGGAGVESFTFNAVLAEEVARAGVSLGAAGAHTDLCLPYLTELATEEQKKRWLPGFVSGEIMFAIAMTEPGTGSDLAAISTTARLSEDGGHYILNGAKTFITGGVHAERVIVCARTSPPREDDRRHGISLLVVDAHSPGYTVGRKLDKLGLRTSDTAELSFTDVMVPTRDLLGAENRGFAHLSRNLPRERLSIAVGAHAQARAALRFTVEYTRGRTAFGRPVAEFQNTKFELAAARTEADAVEAVVDRALAAHDRDELTAVDAASAKLFCTEAAGRIIDRCLQLHGGYGYVTEYPIARLYADNRVNRIFGGTSEVMKIIIAKSMGL